MRRAAPLLFAASAVRGAPAADRVSQLPGYGAPPTPQWSGFLNASAVEPGTYLHYWYAEAELPDPGAAPVVLWLNGGPGSSSLIGMLQEQGPLLINRTGGLFRNPWAWTRLANLLVVESPAGVGYSYCAAGGACANTDKSTARANRAALQDFFGAKFPELARSDFYITGESYAGVYVPTLAREVLDNAPAINLKGVAVGDPCTDMAAQADSMDMLWYGHKYGFVPDPAFDFLWGNCSARAPPSLALGRWGAAAAAPGPRLAATAPAACAVAMRKFLAASSRGFSQTWRHAWINDVSLYGYAAASASWDDEGSVNYMQAQYLRRADVRKALHVETNPLSAAWPGTPDGWSYKSDYAACNFDGPVPPGTPSMVDFYRYIAPKLRRTVVYNGDTDPCVSYEGTRTAIEKVGFPELPGGAYRPWFFNATAAGVGLLVEKPLLFGPSLVAEDAGAQLGGMVVDYAHNLSFVTVHGSGHMVPQFRPRAALRMLSSVLSGRELAPPLAADAELGAMSDADFDAFLDAWTVRAQRDA